VTAITAITSLGAFGSLFVNNPAWWAKLVVFVLAAATSILTALRQDARWLRLSQSMRSQGAKWTHQRNEAQNLASRIIDGGCVTSDELAALSAMDERLVGSNPALSSALYAECKREKAEEFDLQFALGREVTVAGGPRYPPRQTSEESDTRPEGG